jgi:hypothetical protein
LTDAYLRETVECGGICTHIVLLTILLTIMRLIVMNWCLMYPM